MSRTSASTSIRRSGGPERSRWGDAAVSCHQRHRGYDGADQRHRARNKRLTNTTPIGGVDRPRPWFRQPVSDDILRGRSRSSQASCRRTRSACDERAHDLGAGGMDDVERIDYMAPTPLSCANAATERSWSSTTTCAGHFFITAEPAEAAMLDAGILVPGWLRTHYEFKSAPGEPVGLSACRFSGPRGLVRTRTFSRSITTNATR